jgi:hypothetical protein
MKPLTVLGIGRTLATEHDARDDDNAAVIDWNTGRYDGVTRTVRYVVTGEITDVDRNSGKVDIAPDDSKVQLILPPLAVATTNKGDRAAIDVTIGRAR